jgi:GH25 family lysozyme M1 (1,4-beta-N-acetylmuramidase)
MTTSPDSAAAQALQPCIVDASVQDGVTPAKVAQLIAAGYPWAGIILQASNGLTSWGSWFNSCWAAARATSRYGVDWMRCAYHYLRVDENSSDQADLHLATVQAAGGFGPGDIWTAVDVERGEQPADATKAQVEASINGFADRIMQRTGRATMLYAGSYTRGLGITSLLNCKLLWYPQWNPTLNWSTVASMGGSIADTLLWQVVGDNSNTAPVGYPRQSPIGPLDYSVMVRGNLPYAQGIDWTLTRGGAQPR